MRSVPYRVVCLLGMDDTRFPRSSRDDGDDLLLGDERVGDFDRSSEDRQLLLDAVMAAGDHLVVTYAGRDQLTNAALPPAVPIAELYDTLREMVGADGVAAIEIVHPLQSFSEANFTPGALDLPGPFGFDPVALAGARALAAPPVARPTPAWPEPEPAETIDLDDLIRFLQHPTQRFLQTRIGMSIPDPGEIPDDTLPADLDALAAWGVKERLLDGLAAGYDLDQLTRRAVAGDALPPGALGEDDLDGAVDAATALWEAATGRGYDRHQMRPYRGSVTVGDTVIEGAVSADPGQAHLFTVTASKVKGRHRLRAFAELAFLSALEPDIAWKAHVLGRHPDRGGHVAVTFGPVRRVSAHDLLAELVALYVEGQQHPLPVPCETGFTWQRNIGSGRGRARYRAGDAWGGNFGEGRDPANAMLLDAVTIDDLLDAGLEDYCTRLWAPIFGLMGEKQL
jgi:exodeoxyribonuclease V gamma subunit